MSRRDLVVAGADAVELRHTRRPQGVRVAVLPEDVKARDVKAGPLAFIPCSGVAELGVAVLAVERTPEGRIVAIVAAIGSAPSVLSPGDVLAVLP